MNNEDYAIVVGVRYPFLRPLRATLSDAGKFIEWLESPTGGALPPGPKHIKAILSTPTTPDDPFNARPIQADIDAALRDLGIRKGTRIGRRLYFYFSGHGFGTLGEEDDIGMLMANAEERGLNSNIGLNKYVQMFRNTRFFDEIVFFLDCCRDPAPAGKDSTVGVNRPMFNPKHDDPVPLVQRFLVLAASYGRKAFEKNGKKQGERRGLLTRAVLEGLTLPRAADAQGRFTSSSLRAYILDRVPELAKESGDKLLEQKPEVPALPDTEIVFGTVAAANANLVQVRIIAPAGLGGDIHVHDDKLTLVTSFPAASATKQKPPVMVPMERNRNYEVISSERPPTGADIMPWAEVEANNYVYNFPKPS